MKKRNLLLAIAVMLCSYGFSQNGKYPVKILIGNTLCENQVEISRTQLLKEGKITCVVNGEDTVYTVGFTMQLTKGKDLTEMLVAKDPSFTTQMIKYIEVKDEKLKSKKIWIEKIKMEYKGESILLPMFTILVKD